MNSDVWSLPGGVVGIKEGINQAAERVLNERTGLSDIFLEQFYCFGEFGRNVNARLEFEKSKVISLELRMIWIGFQVDSFRWDI